MRKYFLLISLLVLIVLNSCNNIKSVDDVHGVKTTLDEYSVLTVRDAGIGEVQAGETVEVFAQDILAYQIRKSNGDIGWIDNGKISFGKTARMGQKNEYPGRSFYNEPTVHRNPDAIEDIPKSYDLQEVEVLEVRKLHGRVFLNIKFVDGKSGWVRDFCLYPFSEKIPESPSQARYHFGKLWLFNIEKLQKKAIGKDTDWLMKKFGFPSGKVSKMKGSENGAWYYENIEIYQRKSAGRVARFEIKDDKIVGVGIADIPDGKISAWLPLSKMMRNFGFGNTYRNLPNIMSGISNSFEKDGPVDRILPGILFIPIKIILGILFLVFAIIYTMLPIVAVTLFVSIRSMRKDVSTGSLILIQGIAGVLLGHLWFLFLIYHDSYFYLEPFLAILLLPIAGNSIIAYMMKTLEYNRCENCKFWSGFGIGSIWLSTHSYTTTTTTKTYEGDSLKDTKVEKKTKSISRFKDLRKCANCGHEWSIIREE